MEAVVVADLPRPVQEVLPRLQPVQPVQDVQQRELPDQEQRTHRLQPELKVLQPDQELLAVLQQVQDPRLLVLDGRLGRRRRLDRQLLLDGRGANGPKLQKATSATSGSSAETQKRPQRDKNKKN